MPTLVTRRIRRSELPRSVKILIALLAAVIFHLLFLLLLAWALPHWPKARMPARSAPFRLTITKATPAPVVNGLASSDKPTPPPYIRTLDEQASDKAPDQPAFQSDKNTLEAAELAATGDKPLPTMQGKDIPAFDFDTRPFRLDKVAADAATAAPASPTDSKNPSKDKERNPTAHTTAPDSKTKPSAQPQPTATPPVGELATLKSQPSPTPAATPDEFPDVSQTPPPPEADPLARQSPVNPATPSTVTSRGLPKRPGYQPETIQTKMAGAISNRGRPSPGALGTPFGRYQKAISDAVGMRWYYYVAQQADLISVGTVKVHFVIAASGRVHDVKVVSGNANGVLADISEQAINEAEIPPIPPDVAATLSGNQMDMDFDFSEY
jgi:outer membrane biosynthesis protein TonB